MEVADGRSSSNDLSSAPPSDAEGTPGPPHYLSSHRSTNGNLGVANILNGPPAHTSPGAGAGAGGTSSATAAGGRQADPAAQPPVKKPRKKREPKDPNAPPAKPRPRKPKAAPTAATTSTGSRKRTKIEPVEDNSTIHIPGPQNQDLQSSTLVQPVSFSPQPPPESRRNDAAKYSQSGFTMHEPPIHTPPRTYEYNLNMSAAPPPPLPSPQSSTPRPSMYDPIRGSVMQRPLDTNPPPTVAKPTITPPRPTYNPSTSPAISGIIDHPPQPAFAASTVFTHHPQPEPTYNQTSVSNMDSPRVNGSSSTMDIDFVDKQQTQSKKPSRKVPSEAPTRATSPKPRSKEQLPPPPIGSGLLSASLFGGDSSCDMAQKDTEKGPNIVLHVDLNDPSNRVINFARMAEAKYGFTALYPRQAAQKERLAKIAAAGAALERTASGSKLGGGTSAGESGDEDLSVDIERDSENDGDIAMSGVNGQEIANSGTDGPGQKRRRRRKVEEYDQDDPFVDDSETLWEAQAAASKDGFFVYCGPLVPEGEKPAVERYEHLYGGLLLIHLLTSPQSRWYSQTCSWSRPWRRSWFSRWSRRRCHF